MLSTSYRTWDHIKENDAVLIQRKFMYDIIEGGVYIYPREIYKKRNGKKCYVDYPGKEHSLDKTDIKHHSTFCTVPATKYFQSDDSEITIRKVHKSVNKKIINDIGISLFPSFELFNIDELK